MGLRVLLVQTSAVMGSLLARTLRQSGLPIDEVQQAATWDDAVLAVKRRVPDVALLDADLPGCSTGMDLGTALAVPPGPASRA